MKAGLMVLFVSALLVSEAHAQQRGGLGGSGVLLPARYL
jgi:hypothetical protein